MMEPVRKRKRMIISCTLCRRRKIRCNHEAPCSNCVRSGNATCVYENATITSGLTGRNAPLQPRLEQMHPESQMQYSQRTSLSGEIIMADLPSRYTPPTPVSIASQEMDSMKRKIAELEHQLSRTTTSASNTATTPSIIAPSPAPTNFIHISSGIAGPVSVLGESRAFGNVHSIARGIAHKNRVFGQSHWMNGFVVFRDIVEMIEPHVRDSNSTLSPNLERAKMLARVIKSARSPTWPTMPSTELPPKHICDELVNHYLNTIETLYRVVHVPTFQRDYEAVWNNKAERKIGFVMQLKLILALGAIFHDENCTMRSEATQWIYEAQTWMSSPSFKSKLGIQYLQISILLLLAREFADVGSELVWISAGSLLREAVYIGLHKDPSQLPRMNVFESEMRRRIWNTILELNLQFSLISGGPCLISLEDFTTEAPGNFDDYQLVAPDPQARPEHVLTSTSYAIALRGTLSARLAVVKFLNDVGSTGTYEETLRIDTGLRDSYKALRRRLNVCCAQGSPSFAREAIDFIMQRYISSLHIPYFNPALHDAVYAFSRKAVLDTSLNIWKLGFSPSALDETQLVRLCRCGAGFFRAFLFHASSFLVIELRAQVQEEDSVPRPDLLSVPEDAANLVLRCIEAGETGIKGYLLLRVLIAQIEATKRHVGNDVVQALLGQAAKEAVEHCLPMLERMAGQPRADQINAEGVAEFDFQFSPDLMADWDTGMADIFSFPDSGPLVGGIDFGGFLT
ncbi:hypothetical protein DE146DRAFT_678794 [Phaeosphaeria sp. MPI-PUGE-AT-0046c]|nr:hypothetical protein DE146DRAFT_678794 [Phaeosphaeria sp. MPI-PUGE-AT-0046c]